MTDDEIRWQKSITKLDRLGHLGVVRPRARRWVEQREQLIGDDEYEDFAQAMARVPR